MNATSIEWCDATCNPVVGCLGGCPYCYARAVARRSRCPECREFKPHFHPERLDQLRRGKPKRVFVGSMTDLFGEGVDPNWTIQALSALADGPHIGLILTKRPDLMGLMLYGNEAVTEKLAKTGRLWLGVTVTCQDDLWRVEALADEWPGQKFASCEPLLGPIEFSPVHLRALEWVIIGGLSAPRDLRPTAWHETGWAAQLVEQMRDIAPVFVKTRPRRLAGVPSIQRWPEGWR